MDFDVSVIITAHNEGRLAHPTMCSVFRAIRYANEKGIKCEIIVVLDRPDTKTQDYFRRYRDSEIKIHHIDFGDPGLSRNYGVQVSSGKFIAFLDADDLFGKNWLKDAYYKAESNCELCVYHPEYVVCFGRENFIAHCKGTDDKELNIGDLIEFNYWNSALLSKKSLLTEIPFETTLSDSGFGYEDWHWYCEIIARGINVRTVTNTCVFLRRKLSGSRLSSHNYKHTIIRPSKLFESAIFSSILNKEAYQNNRKNRKPWQNDKKFILMEE